MIVFSSRTVIREKEAALKFPITIHSSKRYLINAQGQPFLPVVESAWSCASMLTTAQVDAYVQNRAAKGFTGMHMMCPVFSQTNNTPAYANVYGQNPFTDNNDFSTYNNTFFNHVEYVVRKCRDSGLQVYLFPGYLGYLGNGTEGWATQINHASNTASKLAAFGRMLSNRLATYKNVVLVLGGDYGDATTIAKQFNIVRGWREIDPTVLISAHGGRSSNAYTVLTSQLTEIGDYFLNGIYTNDYEEYSAAATEYGRAGPIPCIDMDHQYEGWAGHTADYTMLGQHVSMLSGMRGFMFGNVPVCEFGAGFYGSAIGAASTLSGQLESAGALRTQYAATLYRSYAWHLLEPKTDASLVTTALGTGSGRIAPALASDGSFAMIWTPNVNVTVAMTALTPSSVRCRWWNPVDGSYSTDGASPLANTGTHAFTAPGTRILLLDAA